MNQYIITEKLVKFLEEHFWDIDEVLKLRSHPYNPQANRKKSCLWKENEEYGMWETGCKNSFEFIEGDIEENSFKFCPYCGGKIKERQEGKVEK